MLEVPSFMIVFGFLSYYSAFFVELCLLALKQYNIHRFTIPHDKELIKPIMKRLEKECVCSDTALSKGFKKTISGWFWSPKVIGRITHDTYGDTKITLLTTNAYFEYLVQPLEDSFEIYKPSEEPEISEEPKNEASKISVFSRYGSYKEFCYSRVLFNVTTLEPILDQGKVVSDVVRVFRKKRQCNVFIEGPPCSGKSSVGYLIAKELHGAFCNTFNPTEPGDMLSSAISRIQDWLRDDDIPIIILVDEVDTMLKKIHANDVKLNNDTPTLIYDKPSWSKFMDNMRFYKNIILIFTSNSSKSEIDKLDASYLRPGRIDICHVLDSPVYKEDGTFLG